jgi:RNA polymerase sigma-70 factor, ECF subfamily
MTGHLLNMEPALIKETSSAVERPNQPEIAEFKRQALRSFGEIYEEYFAFVWRSAKRMGVAEANVEDVVQDVFLVAHRRMGDFEARCSIKTWLFAILLRTVRGHKRTAKRKPTYPLVTDNVADVLQFGPHESRAKNEAIDLLHNLLDSLDDDKRAVFIQAELEQMTAQEIAEAMGTNVKTVYSRLRAARREFEEAIARLHARDGWRLR